MDTIKPLRPVNSALRRDLWGGAAMTLIGLATAFVGFTYPIGTLGGMGPGFFPIALGTILAFIGVLIVVTPSTREPAEPGEATISRVDWRGFGCILGGVAAFIVLGLFAGMVPAAFACILISAFADRSISPLQAFTLAIVVTAVGSAVFGKLLGIPLPLFAWPF